MQNLSNSKNMPFPIKDELEVLKDSPDTLKIWDATRPKMKTYKIRSYKGSIGDFAREWWTDEDHDRHAAYVEELKATGEYLKPETITVSLVENPLYDSPSLTPTVESARLEFLDFAQPPVNSTSNVMVNPEGNAWIFTGTFEKVSKQWKDLYESLEYQMIYGKPSFEP